MPTVFVTFGAGSLGWKQASRRLAHSALKLNLFSEVVTLGEDWLKSDEPDIFRIIKNFRSEGNKKGFGYYVWKPALLHKIHKEFPGHDILYMDAGSQIETNLDSRKIIYELITTNISRGLAWQLPNHIEKYWTKNELIKRLNVPSSIQESNQIQSGFILIPAISQRAEFVKNFYELALESDGFYFSDETHNPQITGFIGHRHDQSVFSILWKQFKFGITADKTFPENIDLFPIIAMRNQTFLSARSHNLLHVITKKFNSIIDRMLKH
jgi:hypothetical protein